MSKQLICMVGLPRSGKSTIVRELQKSLKCPVVRRDDIRLELHGQRYAHEAEPFVKAISTLMIRTLFRSHDTVICDETNYSRAARDLHKSDQWETLFYEVDTPVSICQERAIATQQPDLVDVIAEMYNRKDPLGEDEKRYPVPDPENRLGVRRPSW
jgi:predicted kinase